METTPVRETFGVVPPLEAKGDVAVTRVTQVGQAIVPVVVIGPPVIGPVVAMLVTVPLFVPGKGCPVAKVIRPFLSMFSFGEIVPVVGPNWKLRLPFDSACNCAVCEALLPSVAFRRNRL